jgi:hypothetical protein
MITKKDLGLKFIEPSLIATNEVVNRIENHTLEAYLFTQLGGRVKCENNHDLHGTISSGYLPCPMWAWDFRF